MRKLLFMLGIVLLGLIELNGQCTSISCDNTTNTGINSSAIGTNSESSGHSAFASGYNAVASGNYSVALGINSEAIYSQAISIGSSVIASMDRSIVLGCGNYGEYYFTNNIERSLMVGFSSRYPTLFVGESPLSQNNDKTGKIGIGNVTDPQAKLHLKADEGENAVMLIQPYNWLAGESASLALGSISYGITSNKDQGFVFKSALNYIFRDGKIGIGNFNANLPEAKVHIKCNSGETADLYIEPFKMETEGSWQANLYLGTKENIISGVSDYGLVYSTSINHIFQGGNVGIGTTEPLEILHVADENGAILYNGGQFTIASQNIDPVLSLKRPNGRRWNMYNGVMETLLFGFNSSSLEGAKVGITENLGVFIRDGITISDMEIFGEPKADIYVIQNIQDETYNEIAAEYTTTEGGRLFFVPRLDDYSYCPSTKLGDAGIFWSNTTNQNDNGGLVIGPHDTENNIYGVRIDSNGSVGIGVTEPAARLDVRNRIQISGWDPDPDPKSFIIKSTQDTEVFVIKPNGETKIANKLWAQEIEVVADVWSDFVFNESHKLRSLKDVEDFIVKNKHLPDVPSEKTIKEEGLNLGEMDALLLQKIEELTLYIIDQDKKIEELKSETKDLKEKLKETNQQYHSN